MKGNHVSLVNAIRFWCARNYGYFRNGIFVQLTSNCSWNANELEFKFPNLLFLGHIGWLNQVLIDSLMNETPMNYYEIGIQLLVGTRNEYYKIIPLKSRWEHPSYWYRYRIAADADYPWCNMIAPAIQSNFIVRPSLTCNTHSDTTELIKQKF